MNKKIISLFTILTMLLCSIGIVSAQEFEKRYVSASALNCRKEPNINSDVITVFQRDTELQIIGADREWWQVYDGTTQGWCHSAYLKPYISYNNNNIENTDGTYLGDYTITYYTCSPSENGGSHYTATGHRLTDVVGVAIAADPRIIPYYSKVYIEGIGVRTVLDCGGAIKGNKIDVLVRNSGDIPACGVHNAKVYLIN